jgi:hypothetical protein
MPREHDEKKYQVEDVFATNLSIGLMSLGRDLLLHFQIFHFQFGALMKIALPRYFVENA